MKAQEDEWPKGTHENYAAFRARLKTVATGLEPEVINKAMEGLHKRVQALYATQGDWTSGD
jgi:hypothetical protein